jgi:hypothetical protein
MIGLRTAYIVPGDVDEHDVQLSLEMKLPMFCGDLLQMQFVTLRSGAKRIFELSDIPVPPSRYDIGTPDQFYESLGKLVLSELLVNTWIFKIDTEKSGKGMATINLSDMKYLSHLRNNYDSISPDNIHVLVEELRKEVPARVKVPAPFESWETYLAQFCAKHGVIEATPLVDPAKITPFCVTFTIQPDGEIADISAFDRYQVDNNTAEGHLYPQQSLKGLNTELLVSSLGKTLYQRKGVWGFMKVDLIAFPDPLMNGEELFWALDLNAGLSVYDVSARMFDCLLFGEFDLVRKQYLISAEDESAIVEDLSRCYFMCERIVHSGLSSKGLSVFLSACEEANLAFDSRRKVGVVLLPYDNLASNMVGLMVVGASKGECRRLMSRALNTIDSVLNPKGRISELQASYDEKSSLLSIVKNLSL